MSRKVYDNGQLVESWDDVTRTYRRYVNGSLVETRAYTTDEIGSIVGAGRIVIDERDVVMFDDDGSVMFRLGKQTQGDRGFELSRANGTLAFAVSEVFQGGVQALRMFDNSGNNILSEESLGSGLGRPYLSLPMQPVLATAGTVNAGPYGFEVVTSSTSWTPVARTQFPRQNQYVTVKVQVAASDLTTAASVRVTDTVGGVLSQFLSGPFTANRAAGSTGYVEVALPSLVVPGAYMGSVALDVQVQRTAGTGSLRVAVTESRGG